MVFKIDSQPAPPPYITGLEPHKPYDLYVRGGDGAGAAAAFTPSPSIRVVPRDVARGWVSPAPDLVRTQIEVRLSAAVQERIARHSRASVAADFNSDGMRDVFVANSDGAANELMMNDGAGVLKYPEDLGKPAFVDTRMR